MIKKFLTMLALACLTAAGAYADGIEVTPTANANEWTFAMPAADVELQVAYYTDQDFADNVAALIAAIGTVAPTPECKGKIDAARAAYDALTGDQKALVANYDALTQAEEDYYAYFHTVSLAAGTEDASNWKAKAGEGDFAALPLRGLESNTVVTVKYDGEKIVKGVKAVKVNPLAVPLTIEALTAGTVNVNMSATLSTGMKYSLNGGDKTTIYNTTDIVVAKGDKVQFYGNGTSTQVYGDDPEVSILGNGEGFTCKVYGNIMSLLDEENFATKTDLPNQEYVFYFYGLFKGNTKLTDASGLLLPAETLTEACYPSMFNGCIALTTAPELPAKTLVKSCYQNMFNGCSKLSSVTCLATDISANCTRDWLKDVAGSGTFTKAAGVDWSGKTGTDGIPSGWTVKEAAAAEPEVTEWDLTSEDGKVWTLAEMPAGDVELKVEYEKTYTANLADGTEDAAKWTIDPEVATNTGVTAGTSVTVTYSGEKKIKSIKAADIVGIKFEANGNSTIIENVALPHTFVCDSNSTDGDFDRVLRELYGWAYDSTFCNYNSAPSSTDAGKVDAKLENYNHTFTIGSAFEGAVTVTGKYIVNFTQIPYSVDISIVAVAPAPTLTPTENANEWTFTMPAGDVELQVAYYTEDELAAMAVDALIADIGEVAYTAESKALIDAAREAYDALTGDQKALVANYAVLETAETAYVAAEDAAFTDGVELTNNGDGTWTLDATPAFDVELEVEYYNDQGLADEASAAIAAIGEVAYTDECKGKIDAARAAYDALTAEEKALVTNYETLTAAEAEYAALAATSGWVIVDGVVTGYKGPGGDVTIPETATSIGTNAFSGCTNLVSVTIPESVESIGAGAFDGCTALEAIRLPRSRAHLVSGLDVSLSKVAIYDPAKPVVTITFETQFGRETKRMSAGAPLSAPAMSRTGYVFQGWSPAVPAVVPDTDATYTARWTAKVYTVVFNANGGKLPKGKKMAAQKIAYGKLATLRKNVFKRTGRVFAGWATSKANAKKGLIAYKNKQALMNLRSDGGTVTLYAVWAKPTYNVKFYANGGTGEMAVEKFKYNKAKKLTANAFKAPKGRKFAGWATSKKNAKKGVVTYKDKKAVKRLILTGKTVKLYAVWKKK